MSKFLLICFSVCFFFILNAYAQEIEPAKLTLSPSMVVNESGLGDAGFLVDEQALAGDPLAGNGGSPANYWFPGWGNAQYNVSAYIDLGQTYDLSHIFLYDFTGISDFIVETGEPGNWAPLFTDPLSSYKNWRRHDVSVRTRYLRVTRQDGGSNMNEIVLYGTAVNHAPVLTSIADQSVAEGGQVTVDLSATDPDNDVVTFSITTEATFINLTNQTDSTARMIIAPGDPSAGDYNVTVAVSDGKGGMDSTSFLLTVHAAEPGGAIKLTLSPSMVVNESGFGDAGFLVDEQALSGDPLAGNGGSPANYWFPGWGDAQYNASAYIDLGQTYDLSHIFLYDFTGISDFIVETGEPGNWAPLFTDPLSSYKNWRRHDVSVRTRYLRVTRQDGGSNMNEIVVYGTPIEVNEGEVPDAIEYQALKDLYDSTNGDGWINNTNWLQGNTSKEFDNWYGIIIDDGDIVSINLPHNALNGVIPKSIGYLQKLQSLSLYGNALSDLPGSIGNLSALAFLELDDNGFSSLPAEIGNLYNLFQLTLAGNNLRSLPIEIGDLSSLFFLGLSNNNLSELPEEIGNLQNLVFLDVTNNNLTTLPSGIGNLSSLFDFALWYNDLESLPPEIGMLGNLEHLFLTQNKLDTLPNEIGNLNNLRVLKLDENLFEEITDVIGYLPNLTNLSLDKNNLIKLPSTIIELDSLWLLSFSHNRIRVLPNGLASLVNNNLEYLDASHNELGFASLEPFFTEMENHTLFDFVYSPQAPLPTKTVVVVKTSSYTLECEDTAPSNHYQWQKYNNGAWEDIAGATAAAYTISSVSENSQYRCKITNDWVTDMTLYSRTFGVKVEELLIAQPPANLVQNRPNDETGS